ncbi:MAG TPA: PQQ-binding-like beta-propeller repeat protein [Acidobacteriaceae bacterium]|nr:PQQ-binding-like beta-propeller repeat protein [Acidobacteriaceae bacterium]
MNQINAGNVTQLKLAWKFDTEIPESEQPPVSFPGAPIPNHSGVGETPVAPNQAPAARADAAPGGQASAGGGPAAGQAPSGPEAGPGQRPGGAAPRRRRAGGGTESIPVEVNGVLYMSTGYRQVIALDAETGNRIWAYSGPHSAGLRGISYWPGTKGFPPEIVYGTGDGYIVALDAKTGKPVTSFGDNGFVSIKTPEIMSPKYPNARIGISSPLSFYKNYVITGSSPGEGPTFGIYNDIRAWDMRTGKQVWAFHTIPRPGEPNHDVWQDGEWEYRDGANSWGFTTVDVQRGIVYVPIGTPNMDFYGGDRKGSNLYGSSLVALDANTGKLKWYFQTTHHDNWDYDDVDAPILMTVKHNGKNIPAVAQITKQGLIFIFNRVTGKPIYGVKEVPAPNNNAAPGDSNWPTQPMPVKPPPIARDTFSPDEIATVTPEHEAYCKNLLAMEGGAITGGPFVQYGPKLSVIFPSWTGGVNWGGGAFDPKLGYLIVDSKDLANFNKLVQRTGGGGYGGGRAGGAGAAGGGAAGASGTPAATHWVRVGPDNAPPGMGDYFWDGRKQWPCQQPPWAQLYAVNVNTGEIAWHVPLGSFEELDKLGVPPTGTPTTNGGGIVTAGGLVFIGASTDGKFRAFDTRTGKILWTADLGVDINSIPISYKGKDGKQYVAVVAGGGTHHGAKAGIVYVYSLP